MSFGELWRDRNVLLGCYDRSLTRPCSHIQLLGVFENMLFIRNSCTCQIVPCLSMSPHSEKFLLFISQDDCRLLTVPFSSGLIDISCCNRNLSQRSCSILSGHTCPGRSGVYMLILMSQKVQIQKQQTCAYYLWLWIWHLFTHTKMLGWEPW